jgi:hypothetical protein
VSRSYGSFLGWAGGGIAPGKISQVTPRRLPRFFVLASLKLFRRPT